MTALDHMIKTYPARGIPVCRVLVAESRGSAPRDGGAEMFVHADGIDGTIGGGTLEYEVIAIARRMIDEARNKPDGFHRHWQDFALGPNLGQCCGGNVTMLFEAFDAKDETIAKLTALADSSHGLLHTSDHDTWPVPLAPDAATTTLRYDKKNRSLAMPPGGSPRALYVYGAGHVGRALMEATAPLGLRRFWVDTAKERFPDTAMIADDITVIPAAEMALIPRHAEADAIHIVLTYSHRIDEDIVAEILRCGNFHHLGLIGSKTKRARFVSSLAKAGFDKDTLEKIICPIGLAQITSKEPAHVALSIAGQIAVWLEEGRH